MIATEKLSSQRSQKKEIKDFEIHLGSLDVLIKKGQGLIWSTWPFLKQNSLKIVCIPLI